MYKKEFFKILDELILTYHIKYLAFSIDSIYLEFIKKYDNSYAEYKNCKIEIMGI